MGWSDVYPSITKREEIYLKIDDDKGGGIFKIPE